MRRHKCCEAFNELLVDSLKLISSLLQLCTGLSDIYRLVLVYCCGVYWQKSIKVLKGWKGTPSFLQSQQNLSRYLGVSIITLLLLRFRSQANLQSKQSAIQRPLPSSSSFLARMSSLRNYLVIWLSWALLSDNRFYTYSNSLLNIMVFPTNYEQKLSQLFLTALRYWSCIKVARLEGVLINGCTKSPNKASIILMQFFLILISLLRVAMVSSSCPKHPWSQCWTLSGTPTYPLSSPTLTTSRSISTITLSVSAYFLIMADQWVMGSPTMQGMKESMASNR